MIYNPTATINFLEARTLTQSVLTEVFTLASSFKNTYERKIFIIGLSQMLTAQTLPPVLGQNLLLVLDNVIKMLNSQKETEIKTLRKEGRREIKAEDDEDDDDNESDIEDNSDDDDDDDDDSEMEESKGEPTEDHEEEKEDKAKTDT